MPGEKVSFHVSILLNYYFHNRQKRCVRGKVYHNVSWFCKKKSPKSQDVCIIAIMQSEYPGFFQDEYPCSGML